MMPKKLEDKKIELANISNPPIDKRWAGNEHEAFLSGFDACYNELMQNAKVVKIPDKCSSEYICEYYRCKRTFPYTPSCFLYDLEFNHKDVNVIETKPLFCKAKKAIIILEE